MYIDIANIMVTTIHLVSCQCGKIVIMILNVCIAMIAVKHYHTSDRQTSHMLA